MNSRIARLMIFGQHDPDTLQAVRQAFATQNERQARQALEALNTAQHNFGDLVCDPHVRMGLREVQGVSLGTSAHTTLSSSSEFPQGDRPVVAVYVAGREEAIDLTWTQIANVRDFRGQQTDGFDVGEVNDAVVFDEYQEGEKIRLSRVAGGEMTVKFVDVGGGFQWDRNWIRDNQLWKLTDGQVAMTVGYGQRMASSFYEVLTASGLEVIARDSSGANQYQNDVNTINAACNTILDDLAADGYEVSNPTFSLVYRPTQWGDRIMTVVNAAQGEPNSFTGAKRLQYSLNPVATRNVPLGDPYVVLNGRKIQTGIRQDLEVDEDYDILTRSGYRAGYGRYVHVRGNSDQVKQPAMS